MGKNGKKSSPVLGGPAMDHDYQSEDDHRTVMRAAEITGDSKRMAGVKRHHKKVQRGLSSVGKMIAGRR